MTGAACASPLEILRDADACHLASCRYHLAEDIEGHRCTLLYAERGGLELDEIAAVLHVSRQRVDQIVTKALAKKHVRALLRRAEVDADDFAHVAEAS